MKITSYKIVAQDAPYAHFYNGENESGMRAQVAQYNGMGKNVEIFAFYEGEHKATWLRTAMARKPRT